MTGAAAAVVETVEAAEDLVSGIVGVDLAGAMSAAVKPLAEDAALAHRAWFDASKAAPCVAEPRACEIEIVERVRPESVGQGTGVIVPDQVRINGMPVLASADHPVVVHEINVADRSAVYVTLTLLARRICVEEEARG